jgi:hypothetical protein
MLTSTCFCNGLQRRSAALHQRTLLSLSCASPIPARVDRASEYEFRCAGGHAFTRTLTKAEFVELTHTCPECGLRATRAPIAVPGGAAAVARDRQYPYVNNQLPFKYRRDQRTGKVLETIKPVIESPEQERSYAAGGWNGEEWRLNQL